VNFTLPKSGLGLRFKRWYYRRVISSVERTIVFSRRQVETYAQALGVSAEKFASVSYHTTIDGYGTGDRKPQFCLSEGDYIFAGGDSNRDYATLIEAARHLTYRVVIAAHSRNHFRHLDIPANVEIVTVAPEHFLRLMAGARVVAVPLRGGLAQGGQQTYLNAMAMGKPVVVSDDTGAEEYITQGLTGLIVPPGDPARLREALLEILENCNFSRALGRAAKEASAKFSQEHFIQGVFMVIDDCLRGNL
jgi:glycosyltransferase involved in cell wall biosynthesis